MTTISAMACSSSTIPIYMRCPSPSNRTSLIHDSHTPNADIITSQLRPEMATSKAKHTQPHAERNQCSQHIQSLLRNTCTSAQKSIRMSQFLWETNQHAIIQS